MSSALFQGSPVEKLVPLALASASPSLLPRYPILRTSLVVGGLLDLLTPDTWGRGFWSTAEEGGGTDMLVHVLHNPGLCWGLPLPLG